MKFSVLLPTRNRLELLSYAVESVLRQDYKNWEIVISDNCSEENIEEFVKSLSDIRVKYTRTNTYVSVTDNWNNALRNATGHYVIMLGDDDCLMPGYFTKMAQLVKEYKAPDLVFTDANLYAYPGVIQEHPSGYFRNRFVNYFTRQDPYLLERRKGDQIVRESLSFIECIRYNMQLSLIKRDFVEGLADRGPFFQSIFPDFYATVVTFLKSTRTIIYQRPVVTIGIASKSFGGYYFSRNERKGKDFLYEESLDNALKPLKGRILPGNFIYTGWLSAMETIKRNYPEEILDIGARVGYGRYRRLQIVYMFKNYLADRRISSDEFIDFKRQLSVIETLVFLPPLNLFFRILGKLSIARRDSIIQWIRKLIGRPNIFKEDQEVQKYKTILDVFENEHASPEQLREGHDTQ